MASKFDGAVVVALAKTKVTEDEARVEETVVMNIEQVVVPVLPMVVTAWPAAQADAPP